MTAFIGREQELDTLEKAYQSDTFQLIIIYGRRRVGKTRLIQEFCKRHKAIYFCAVDSSGKQNLTQLSRSIFHVAGIGEMGLPAFDDWDSLFDYLHLQAVQQGEKNTWSSPAGATWSSIKGRTWDSLGERKLIFVIDEYPYLAASEEGISSLLQKHIDGHFSKTNLMMILCGSSMSFMERQVLGAQSPLYGRRTGQLLVKPLNYKEAAQFLPDYSLEDKAISYAVTNGVPRYLELMNPSLSLKDNIMNLLLRPDGYLFEEPSNLLKQELREPAGYNAIIAAIAKGATRLNEIAGAVQRETSNISFALNTLISLGIIKKTAPLMGKQKLKTNYAVSDTMFLFWHRFVMPNLYLINAGEGEYLFETFIKPELHNYMGHVFENMCQDWLTWQSKARRLSFIITEIGSWWGTDPRTQTQAEIDIVAMNRKEDKILVGECKFRNEETKAEVYRSLVTKSECLPSLNEKHYALFSRSGFSQELQKMASGEPNLRLVTLEELYR